MKLLLILIVAKLWFRLVFAICYEFGGKKA